MTQNNKLTEMQERARNLVIRIASRELYDADSDHTNIVYYEEQVCNGLDSLITEVWNEAKQEERERIRVFVANNYRIDYVKPAIDLEVIMGELEPLPKPNITSDKTEV